MQDNMKPNPFLNKFSRVELSMLVVNLDDLRRTLNHLLGDDAITVQPLVTQLNQALQWAKAAQTEEYPSRRGIQYSSTTFREGRLLQLIRSEVSQFGTPKTPGEFWANITDDDSTWKNPALALLAQGRIRVARHEMIEDVGGEKRLAVLVEVQPETCIGEGETECDFGEEVLRGETALSLNEVERRIGVLGNFLDAMRTAGIAPEELPMPQSAQDEGNIISFIMGHPSDDDTLEIDMSDMVLESPEPDDCETGYCGDGFTDEYDWDYLPGGRHYDPDRDDH